MPTETLEKLGPSFSTNIDESCAIYLVRAIAGNQGMPGAPLLHLTLLVRAATGAITGHADVTQAVPPPNNDIQIANVTGHVRATRFGHYTKIVTLAGHATGHATLPLIGTWLIPFHAEFAVDNTWTGNGGWTLGAEHVNDVPIEPVK